MNYKTIAILLVIVFVCLGRENAVAAVQDTLLTDEGQIREQLRLAEDLFNSDIRQSLIHARQALDDANAIHSELLIAESEIMVGKCFDYLGANIEALENLKHALAIYDSLDMVSQKAYALRLIGYIYYYAGEHSLALEYYYEVHRNSIALNDTSLMIHAMIGMGSVNGNTSKYDSAILLFQDALRLSRAIGDKATEVQCLFFIGDVYIELKKPESFINGILSSNLSFELKQRAHSPLLGAGSFNAGILFFKNPY